MAKRASPALHSDYMYCKVVYGTWTEQNRREHLYFSLMGPLWKLCLPWWNLLHAFWMTFSQLCLAVAVILLKNATRTRKLIAQICKASTACKVFRIHVPMMTSFWIQWIHWLHWIHVVLLESPTLNCMLYFDALKCLADKKLKGGGVPSPEGFQ